VNTFERVRISSTFGENRFKLSNLGLETRLIEINRTSVELTKRAAISSGEEMFIGGDAGPHRARIVPVGYLHVEEARAAFTEQIRALAEAGADAIMIDVNPDLLCNSIMHLVQNVLDGLQNETIGTGVNP
jgi:methionine synthase I (cobalamin-dependent)